MSELQSASNVNILIKYFKGALRINPWTVLLSRWTQKVLSQLWQRISWQLILNASGPFKLKTFLLVVLAVVDDDDGDDHMTGVLLWK